jgi:hypothetical protein
VAVPAPGVASGALSGTRLDVKSLLRVWQKDRLLPYTGMVLPDPRSKELHMKFRLTRSLYLLALLAAFVVASGAGHKLGTP